MGDLITDFTDNSQSIIFAQGYNLSQSAISDTIYAPTDLNAMFENEQITTSWNANPETNLHKYNIYRDTFPAPAFLYDSVVGAPPDTFYIDTDLVTDYDFTSDALNIVTTLFEGDSVSWIILQYKYDYEAGGFVDEFEDYKEVLDILASTKELVDEYDLYYKDIANSLEGNLSMVFKIGISVMKYHLDIYDTLSNTPILSAVFNDAARFCMGENNSNLNLDVYICPETDEDGGFLQEIFNMRFLATDILFKAYLMVDDENEAIIYDSVKMRDFLEKANQSVEDNVITQEVISMFADQFAFNVIDEATNYTLLEQMYDDGQISIEAMRILADDEYELFSMEFRQRVRSLIR